METKQYPHEKIERNIEIYQDRLSGLSWTQLTLKYKLSMKTIQDIVKRQSKKEESK